MEIRGITVFLCQKIATGKDPFNKPAYITPTYGDANLDGKINSDDISYIEQHLQGTASTEEAEAILGRMIVAKAYTGAELADPVRAPLADVNEDGIVNTEDVAIVQSYIDGTPQSPTIVGTKKYAQTLNEDSIEEKGFTLVGAETCTISALISGTEESPVESGTGKAINFYNPLIGQDALDEVAARILPFTYLAAEVTHRGCPSWDVGGIIKVDASGNWDVPIMNQVMEFGAKLSATVKSFGLSEEEANTLSVMPDVKEVQRQLPEIRQALTDINQSLLSGDTGYMILDEVEIDGTKRLSGFKLMDTPTITDTTKGWLANKNGIGWSSDGFKTISKLGLDMANGKIYADQIAAGAVITNSFKIGKSDTEYAMSFDGTTGEITFGSGVTIAWGDITDAPSIPTKTSELTNDSDYATTDDIPTKTSELTNNSGFAYTDDIPTKTSQLTNDSDYATTDDIPDTSNFIRKYGTYITDTAVWSGSLTANNLTVTGGSINLNTDTKGNNLIQLNYVYDSYGTYAYTKISPIGLEVYDDVGSLGSPSTLYIRSGEIGIIAPGGEVSINTNNEQQVGIVEADEFYMGNRNFYSIFATLSELSDYALKSHTHSNYYESGDNIYANKLYIQGAGTVSGSANTRLAATSPYQLGYASGSSMWYKHDIKPVENEELDPHHLYDIKIYQFKYNDDYLSESDQRYGIDCIGFIAEQVNNVYPIAADLETGKPQNWEMRYIIPPMLALVQEQKKEIDELKERVSVLEA